MRILHVLPGIAPRYGGPSAAILPMTEALNRLPDVRVEIAATDADGAGRRLDRETWRNAATPTHLFRRDFSEQWKFSRELWRWLAQQAKDYDLLHVHALWSFATTAACRAARRHGLPVVLRPCGMLSAYTWGRSAWKKRLYWSLLERHNLSTARYFHATSQAEAQEIAALNLKTPTAVIPQGIDPQAWKVDVRPEELRQRCGGQVGDRPIILFLSRLHPKKGVTDLLLPAFTQLKVDAFLAIAGGPDEHEPGYEHQVRAAVDRLGLAGRVALLGPVAPADRWHLYDGAEVFVLPSHSENFGLVVTEAMARAVPVIVTEAAHACEHVAAAAAGRVVPGKIAPIVSALEELLGNREQARAAGRRGQEYVRANLAWDQVAQKIYRMYQTCLS